MCKNATQGICLKEEWYLHTAYILKHKPIHLGNTKRIWGKKKMKSYEKKKTTHLKHISRIQQYLRLVS